MDNDSELAKAEQLLLMKSTTQGVHSAEEAALLSRSAYSLNTEQLALLVDPKNPWILKAIGGPESLAQALNSNVKFGLSGAQLSDDELSLRKKHYDENSLPEKPVTGLFTIMLQTLDDKILIILIAAAFISLALGLYEKFGQPPQYYTDGTMVPKVDWVEGVAILVAVVIVTVVGSVNDWQKERQFAKLNRKKEERLIEVIRDDSQREVPVEDVVVGDLVCVQPGDILAVDGVLVAANDLECDESSVTGESDTLQKVSATDSLRALDNYKKEDDDCLMISGSKVLQGTGKYIVTAVGKHSMWGKTMLGLQHGPEVTPLQEKLNRIADGIAKFGVWSALILFIVLFIRFLVSISGHNKYAPLSSSEKGNKFMDIFIVAVTIVVVAVPEGLPLAVTLALAFATTRMVRDNCLVRVLKSCETMGGATSVCSDKTGTLTQNKMTVVRSHVRGEEWARQVGDDVAFQGEQPARENDEFSVLMRDSLGLNSTVYETADDTSAIVGSKTEIALLEYARQHLGLAVGELQTFRNSRPVVYQMPFDSARKFMLTVVDNGSGQFRMHVKGAAEIVLSFCSKVDGGEDANGMLDLINSYADGALRCIATAYKDFKSSTNWAQATPQDIDVTELTFLGLYGLQDPLRPGVCEAVKQCQRAGVVVRMVTGDNVRTARAISRDANILNDEKQLVMEGPDFRALSDHEAMRICQQIVVLARSSPQDKRRLVELLKANHETVAVTGDGTNDAPALRLADVGFSMGISGTEVAKEASDIIIMDDNFASIVNALKWGRTVNDAVKKFLQFQLTVNVTAVTLTFISAVASSDNSSVLTAVQLLWVNLIMDTLAALALATDAPTDACLDRDPDNRQVSLITPTMWKMIFGQSVFQLAVTFVLHFAGRQIFNYHLPLAPRDDTRLSALVFNTFVWMQVFNMFVNRRLDNKNNLLVGITRNPFFPAIVLIIAGFQIIIMFFGGAAFHVERQTGAMWGTAIICGLCSIPIGILTRLIPDSWIMKLYPRRAWKFFMLCLDTVEAGFMWVMFPLTWTLSQIWRGCRWVLRIKDDEESEDEKMNSAKHLVDRHLNYQWAPGIERSVSFFRRRHSRSGSQPYFEEFPFMDGHKPFKDSASRSSCDSDQTTLAAFMAPMVVSGAVGGWAHTSRV